LSSSADSCLPLAASAAVGWDGIKDPIIVEMAAAEVAARPGRDGAAAGVPAWLGKRGRSLGGTQGARRARAAEGREGSKPKLVIPCKQYMLGKNY
jgi:hypothetical protein